MATFPRSPLTAAQSRNVLVKDTLIQRFATPEKARRPPVETYRGQAVKLTAGSPDGLLPAASCPKRPSDALSAPEVRTLLALFTAMETTMPMQASRKRRVEVGALRMDVEEITEKTLSEARLAAILALSKEMVCARWLGVGNSAILELYQRTLDGEIRPPTPSEQEKRKKLFEVALAEEVNEHGQIRAFKLPARPVGAQVEIKQEFASTKREFPLRGLSAKSTVSSDGASPTSRRLAVLQRLRAKEEAMRAIENSEYGQLRKKLRSCEDAIAIHPFVASLITRGEAASTTYAEVIQSACGLSFSRQSTTVLEMPDAKAGLDHLIEIAAGKWFFVEDGHFTDARYIHRLPGGCASVPMQSLAAERQRLWKEIAAADPFVTRSEEEPQAIPAKDHICRTHDPCLEASNGVSIAVVAGQGPFVDEVAVELARRKRRRIWRKSSA